MNNAKKLNTRHIALSGLLTALMLALGYVESLMPISVGIPGIKLGLSNSLLIFAIYMLGAKVSLVLMVLKVVLSGLLFGGVSAMAFSLAGGVVSVLVMILLKRVKGLSPIVVSMVGGAAHNVAQVALAMVILETTKLVYYMAVLLLVGLGMGTVTGIAAAAVLRHMVRIGGHMR
ncbi:MAG: Gx transporter family protein [Clostridiales bacterium]|nr:Gx transporter family protein [Clostridiales bacterium]